VVDDTFYGKSAARWTSRLYLSCCGPALEPTAKLDSHQINDKISLTLGGDTGGSIDDSRIHGRQLTKDEMIGEGAARWFYLRCFGAPHKTPLTEPTSYPVPQSSLRSDSDGDVVSRTEGREGRVRPRQVRRS
jgi:hypothetical protein